MYFMLNPNLLMLLLDKFGLPVKYIVAGNGEC